MKEKIIFAPGINTAELQRTLARNDKKMIGERFIGISELADRILIEADCAFDQKIISSDEEIILAAEAAKDVSYFKNASYADFCNISRVLRIMRKMITGQNESASLKEALEQGKFSEKNAALEDIYMNYMKILRDQHQADIIQKIRYAVKFGASLAPETEVFCLKECTLTPLEAELLNLASNGKPQQITIHGLLCTKPRKEICISDYKKCFGTSNEVKTIFDEIVRTDSLDECLVLMTDPSSYSQLFFDESILREIPMTFGSGIPIRNSCPAHLLDKYLQWKTDGYYGSTSLLSIIKSDGFDRKALFSLLPKPDESFHLNDLFELCGELRLSQDRNVNESKIKNYEVSLTVENKKRSAKMVEGLKTMAEMLSLPAEEFIERFSFIRSVHEDSAVEKLLNSLDLSARESITTTLTAMRPAIQKGVAKEEEIIRNILDGFTCSQSSRPGAVHIESVSRGAISLRKNVFLCGMSASIFPGRPREDYLLLDSDFRDFKPSSFPYAADGEAYTSNSRIQKKREQLLDVLRTASSMGSDIHISYSGVNTAELKDENMSSVFYEIFQEDPNISENDAENDSKVLEKGYFSPSYVPARKAGNAFINGKKIIPDLIDTTANQFDQGDLSRSYSPSALNTFFSCRRRFYLQWIMNVPEQEEEDPFQVISAADEGTLAHQLMETLANSNITRTDFLNRSEELFDNYLKNHVPLVNDQAKLAKENFLNMMRAAYDADTHHEVVFMENDVGCFEHPSGVKIHGIPDRVEKEEDGTYHIIDFKTGRSIKHNKDDIDTCLQVVIYAYLMEQTGIKITEGEFRYLRLGETVTCEYNDDMKQKLNNKLLEFKEAMIDGDFSLPDEETIKKQKPCTYCSYKSFCGINEHK